MHRNIRAAAAALFTLWLGASADAANRTSTEEGGWSTFWTAARDAIAGAPSASALAEHRRFEGAGLAFEYPAPLRVTRDAGHAKWTLSYGDFDLEVDAPAGSARAADYLGSLAEILATERAKPQWVDENPVTWCGRDIIPSHLRITLFGDRHDMRGYDMPAPEGQARFLIFDDVLVDGKYSTISEAAFTTFAASIRCEIAKKAEMPGAKKPTD